MNVGVRNAPFAIPHGTAVLSAGIGSIRMTCHAMRWFVMVLMRDLALLSSRLLFRPAGFLGGDPFLQTVCSGRGNKRIFSCGPVYLGPLEPAARSDSLVQPQIASALVIRPPGHHSVTRFFWVAAFVSDRF